jgi:hypothetical protein
MKRDGAVEGSGRVLEGGGAYYATGVPLLVMPERLPQWASPNGRSLGVTHCCLRSFPHKSHSSHHHHGRCDLVSILMVVEPLSPLQGREEERGEVLRTSDAFTSIFDHPKALPRSALPETFIRASVRLTAEPARVPPRAPARSA